MKDNSIDKTVSIASAICCLTFVFLTMASPDQVKELFDKIFKFFIGNYLQNIVWLSFFVDANGAVAKHTGCDWSGAWTIFYWAWWLTWAPFVGVFIARISRGRKIREFVLGALLAPSLLCAIWFNILGGSSRKQCGNIRNAKRPSAPLLLLRWDKKLLACPV